MISLTPSRALQEARDEAPRAPRPARPPASSPGSARRPGVPAGRIGSSTTALAPHAPSRNWPSAPMFHSRIRNASEQARPVRMSGVAFTSVSDRTPTLPNAASAMWGNARIGSPPTNARTMPLITSATTSARSRQRREPARRSAAARGEASAQAAIRPVAVRQLPERRRPRRHRHEQPDLVDVGRRPRRTMPAIRPSYMTSTRSASARISSRSSLISRIAVPSVAPLEQEPVDRLDRPHVQAARGLDGDHHRGLRLDLARQDQPLEVAAREQARLRVDRRRGDRVVRPCSSSASVRAAPVVDEPAAATGGCR